MPAHQQAKLRDYDVAKVKDILQHMMSDDDVQA